VAAIERSRNVTIEVLEQYVAAVGGELELTVRTGNRKIPLVASRSSRSQPTAERERTQRIASAG
jgi:hypothetical protein